MKIFILFLTTFLLNSCMKGKKVDLILHNANIICLDDINTTGEAIAIKDGKIVEIGPERQILNKYRAEEINDVKGREIVPTFYNSFLELDSEVNFSYLRKMEIKHLEQGFTEVFVHNITYNQLQILLKFSTKMELVWHVNLTPSSNNISFTRNYKFKKTSKLQIQGFTLSKNELKEISEACAVAKSKNLQIGINFKEVKSYLSTILKTLNDYKKDHRWYVFNLDDNDINSLKKLEENNFFILLNESNHINRPLFVFGTYQSSNSIFLNLSNYTKNNRLDYIKSLKSISNWASYLSFTEVEFGTLQKGKYANFSILETPISTTSNYNAIYSNATYIKGKKIYSME